MGRQPVLNQAVKPDGPAFATCIEVADTGPNRLNGFWSPLIGKRGIVLSVDPAGPYWDVGIEPHPLIPGARPDRFILCPEPVVEVTPRIAWRRFGMSMIILGILATIVLACWILPRMLGLL